MPDKYPLPDIWAAVKRSIKGRVTPQPHDIQIPPPTQPNIPLQKALGAKPWAKPQPGDIQLPPPSAPPDPTGDVYDELTPDELASLKDEIGGAKFESIYNQMGDNSGDDSSSNTLSSNTISPIGSLMQSAGNDGSTLGGLLGGSGDSDGGFLSSMKPQDWLGVAGLGLNATGQFMNASNQKDQFAQQLALEKQQLAQQLQIAQMGNQTQRDLATQNATQLNPYAQQADLAKLAMSRALASNGAAQVQLGSTTPTNSPLPAMGNEAQRFLSDSALANAASNFEKSRLTANPNASPNNIGKTGLGKAGENADADVNAFMTQRQTTDPAATASSQQALQNALMSGVDQTPAEKDSGGGFWKTLAQIGTIAAPIIAAPFTGGASLAAIGALSGAAGGALSGGGWKGALLGAGLGAIPGVGAGKGLAQGAVAPTLSAGLAQAGKSVLTRPQTALAVANALRH